MDDLFEKFLCEGEKFIKLISEADHNLTNEIKIKGESNPITHKQWNVFVSSHVHYYDIIKKILYAKKIDFGSLDDNLSRFRSSSRFFDEVQCHWSTSYDNIRKSIKEIHCLLIDIDTKYFLGTHKKNRF